MGQQKHAHLAWKTHETHCDITVVGVLGACRTQDKSTEGEIDPDTGALGLVDADGDGYFEDEDCADTEAGIHPGATEICDGLDNDCDDEIDEGVAQEYYADTDGDGFGDSTSTVEACSRPSGYVTNGNDCDDTTADAYPGALEVCDSIDNDCDGEIDEESTYEWFADADSDGFGDPDNVVVDCAAPVGYVADSSDCDDSAPEAFQATMKCAMKSTTTAMVRWTKASIDLARTWTTMIMVTMPIRRGVYRTGWLCRGTGRLRRHGRYGQSGHRRNL